MSEPILEARGLRKWFTLGRDRIEVLTECDLRVARGEFVIIMGRSGSGKSTLLHVLGALDTPQQGDVIFDSQPIFPAPARRRFATSAIDVFSPSERRRIRLRRTSFGFVFQAYFLLPELNVLENVMLAEMTANSIIGWWSKRRSVRARATELLERVGLGHRLRHKPNELSGGERQRVAIARSIVHQPAILFADEPTGNLDSAAAENIMSILGELHDAGQTIVMVTHDSELKRYADRVFHLDQGRLHPASHPSQSAAVVP